jgi:hypothetical protein
MSTIIDFIKSKQLTFCAIKYDSKNYNTIKIDNDIKWHEMGYNMSLITYNNKEYINEKNKVINTSKYNGVMINLYGGTKYICFDADSVTANNFMINFISENDLNNISTPSYSHRFGKNNFKNHYYFKLPENVIFNDNKKLQFENHDVFGSLDILILIAEYKLAEIDFENISEIPIDLLKRFGDVKDINDVQPESNDTTEDVNESKYIDLLKLYKADTGDKYSEWRMIGTALASIDEYLIDVFDKFSEKRDKYKGKSDVKKYWKTWVKSDNDCGGIGYLINIAKRDNIDGYNKWCTKWCKNEMKDKNDDEYKRIKELLQDKLFIVLNPLKYGYINDDNETLWYDLIQLKQVLKTYQVGKKDFVDLWLQDPQRKTYNKIDFIPNNTNEKIYNTFKGFKYDNDDKINMDKIRPFLDLINELLDNEQTSISALLNWISWVRQRPTIKTNKAVVLYSEFQGVGKNTIVELFRKVIGYDTKKEKIEDLVSRFNYDIVHKLIINVDEVDLRPSLSNDIKNMITRSTIKAEKKFGDGHDLNDFANYIYTTNNQKSFYIEPTDRRFYAFECKNNIMTEEKSLELYTLLNDDECLKSFDSFIKIRPLPDRLPNLDNKYKKYLISMSLPPYITMIYRKYIDYAKQKLRVSQLYNDAVLYAKEQDLNHNFSAKKMAFDFGKEFKEFIEIKDNTNYYVFPKDNELLAKLKKIRPELVID